MTAVQTNNSSDKLLPKRASLLVEEPATRNLVRSNLDLVCITFSKAVRFPTMTRSRHLKLNDAERDRAWHELYVDNLQRLNQALDFCQQQEIKLYCIPSSYAKCLPSSTLD